MKKIYYLLLLALLGTLSSCDEFTKHDNCKPGTEEKALNIGLGNNATVSLSCQSHKDYKLTEVSSTNMGWAIAGNSSWVSLSPTQGKDGNAHIGADVSENTSTAMRSASFVFRSTDSQWPYEKSFTITQEGAKPTIQIGESNVVFTRAAQSRVLNVTSNVTNWATTVAYEGTTYGWLTAKNINNGKNLEISVTECKAASPLRASVTLSSGSTSVKIDVTQINTDSPVGTSSLNIKQSGGNYEVTLNAVEDWAATTPASWLNVTPSSGKKGEGKLVISATANTSTKVRESYVTIAMTQLGTFSIPVTQEGMKESLDVDPRDEASLPSRGGTHQVHISCNSNWKAQTKNSWMKLSATSGSGDADVNLVAEDNPSIHERKDTTLFQLASGQALVEIVTRQAARYLRVDNKEISFWAKGGTSPAINVDTDADFTVTTKDSWITISRNGNQFTITVEAQNADREGKVTVAMTGLKAGESFAIDIPVHQQFETDITKEGFDVEESWDLQITPGTPAKLRKRVASGKR